MSKLIDDSIVSQIKESLDIVSIISDYLSLKKTGQNYSAICPFHHEKTPSFNVNPQKQIFYCFGCGEGGDIFTFLMKIDSISFSEALFKLSHRSGIKLPQFSKRSDEKNALYILIKKVAQFYHKSLINVNISSNAITYLKNRKISSKTIKEFNIGYAPNSWNAVLTNFGKRKEDIELLEEAGLIVKKKSGSGYYDRFRNRITFPINDNQGNVVGFGARVLDDTLPKYLNSPETTLFNKRRILFGFDKIKGKKHTTLFLVEGYLDVLTAWQYGLKNVVATLGTASSEDHFKQIKRVADEVVLLFDGDKAGQKAVQRALIPAGITGINAKVICLPEGEDPDSFLHNHGSEKLLELSESALSLNEYFINKQINQIKALPMEQKNSAMEELIESIANSSGPIQQQHFINIIADELGVREEILSRMIVKSVAKERRKEYVKPNKPRQVKNKEVSETTVEEILVHLLLHNMVDRNTILMEITPDFFNVEVFKKTVEFIVDSAKNNENAPWELNSGNIYRKIESYFKDHAGKISRLILQEPKYDNVGNSVLSCIKLLKRRSINKTLKELEDKIREEEKNGNFETVDQLLKEQLKLNQIYNQTCFR